MRKNPTRLMQGRIAELAIGTSTLRNQGAPGVLSAARKFLKQLDLAAFRTRTPERFQARLNMTTRHLKGRLPRGARNWGAARKAVNIFLRDVLYNHYLRSRHALNRLEEWLEVPLDRDVAAALRGESEGAALPRWKTIKRLTPDVSRRYQSIAEVVARRKGTDRVHLDLHYWRRRDGAT